MLLTMSLVCMQPYVKGTGFAVILAIKDAQSEFKRSEMLDLHDYS